MQYDKDLFTDVKMHVNVTWLKWTQTTKDLVMGRFFLYILKQRTRGFLQIGCFPAAMRYKHTHYVIEIEIFYCTFEINSPSHAMNKNVLLDIQVASITENLWKMWLHWNGCMTSHEEQIVIKTSLIISSIVWLYGGSKNQ